MTFDTVLADYGEARWGCYNDEACPSSRSWSQSHRSSRSWWQDHRTNNTQDHWSDDYGKQKSKDQWFIFDLSADCRAIDDCWVDDENNHNNNNNHHHNDYDYHHTEAHDYNDYDDGKAAFVHPHPNHHYGSQWVWSGRVFFDPWSLVFSEWALIFRSILNNCVAATTTSTAAADALGGWGRGADLWSLDHHAPHWRVLLRPYKSLNNGLTSWLIFDRDTLICPM